MENKNNNMNGTEEKTYEVEGYDQCHSVNHRCLHDCINDGKFWTSND